MKKQPGKAGDILTPSSITHALRAWQFLFGSGNFEFGTGKSHGCALLVFAALMSMFIPAVAQDASSRHSDGVTIRGTVHNSAGKLVGDASVRLERKGVPGAVEAKTNALGAFAFSALTPGIYIVSAEKSGLHSGAAAVDASSVEDGRQIDLVLEGAGVTQPESKSSSPSPSQAMEFADKPNFTVAAVTDWTAAGGHGSDSILRTSEALTRETLTLKAEHAERGAPVSSGEVGGIKESESKLRAAVANAPRSFEANHRLGAFYLRAGRYGESIPLLQAAYQIDPKDYDNEFDLALSLKEGGDYLQASEHVQRLLAHRDNADLHRMAGELFEKLGDPLAAVRQFEQAARQDPSEQDYFEWGSELLLHRAVWQAKEVFAEGTKAYPKSPRMLTALGTALFSGALYDEAALRFCEASDLNPADPEPYIFMGKIEMAAPNPLACVEEKLARFVEQQPMNPLANFYYAMAIWKQKGQPTDQRVLQRVEAMLTKAVTINPKCGEAFLQLGNLNSSQRNYQRAIDFYTKAVEANPQLIEAHYRLGVAYDRIGERAKARQEFQLHDEIQKQQAAAVERQRKEVKQFLVIVPGKPTYPLIH